MSIAFSFADPSVGGTAMSPSSRVASSTTAQAAYEAVRSRLPASLPLRHLTIPSSLLREEERRIVATAKERERKEKHAPKSILELVQDFAAAKRKAESEAAAVLAASPAASPSNAATAAAAAATAAAAAAAGPSHTPALSIDVSSGSSFASAASAAVLSSITATAESRAFSPLASAQARRQAAALRAQKKKRQARASEYDENDDRDRNMSELLALLPDDMQAKLAPPRDGLASPTAAEASSHQPAPPSSGGSGSGPAGGLPHGHHRGRRNNMSVLSHTNMFSKVTLDQQVAQQAWKPQQPLLSPTAAERQEEKSAVTPVGPVPSAAKPAPVAAGLPQRGGPARPPPQAFSFHTAGGAASPGALLAIDEDAAGGDGDTLASLQAGHRPRAKNLSMGEAINPLLLPPTPAGNIRPTMATATGDLKDKGMRQLLQQQRVNEDDQRAANMVRGVVDPGSVARATAAPMPTTRPLLPPPELDRRLSAHGPPSMPLSAIPSSPPSSRSSLSAAARAAALLASPAHEHPDIHRSDSLSTNEALDLEVQEEWTSSDDEDVAVSEDFKGSMAMSRTSRRKFGLKSMREVMRILAHPLAKRDFPLDEYNQTGAFQAVSYWPEEGRFAKLKLNDTHASHTHPLLADPRATVKDVKRANDTQQAQLELLMNGAASERSSKRGSVAAMRQKQLQKNFSDDDGSALADMDRRRSSSSAAMATGGYDAHAPSPSSLAPLSPRSERAILLAAAPPSASLHGELNEAFSMLDPARMNQTQAEVLAKYQRQAAWEKKAEAIRLYSNAQRAPFVQLRRDLLERGEGDAFEQLLDSDRPLLNDAQIDSLLAAKIDESIRKGFPRNRQELRGLSTRGAVSFGLPTPLPGSAEQMATRTLEHAKLAPQEENLSGMFRQDQTSLQRGLVNNKRRELVVSNQRPYSARSETQRKEQKAVQEARRKVRALLYEVPPVGAYNPHPEHADKAVGGPDFAGQDARDVHLTGRASLGLAQTLASTALGNLQQSSNSYNTLNEAHAGPGPADTFVQRLFSGSQTERSGGGTGMREGVSFPGAGVGQRTAIMSENGIATSSLSTATFQFSAVQLAFNDYRDVAPVKTLKLAKPFSSVGPGSVSTAPSVHFASSILYDRASDAPVHGIHSTIENRDHTSERSIQHASATLMGPHRPIDVVTGHNPSVGFAMERRGDVAAMSEQQHREQREQRMQAQAARKDALAAEKARRHASLADKKRAVARRLRREAKERNEAYVVRVCKGRMGVEGAKEAVAAQRLAEKARAETLARNEALAAAHAKAEKRRASGGFGPDGTPLSHRPSSAVARVSSVASMVSVQSARSTGTAPVPPSGAPPRRPGTAAASTGRATPPAQPPLSPSDSVSSLSSDSDGEDEATHEIRRQLGPLTQYTKESRLQRVAASAARRRTQRDAVADKRLAIAGAKHKRLAHLSAMLAAHDGKRSRAEVEMALRLKDVQMIWCFLGATFARLAKFRETLKMKKLMMVLSLGHLKQRVAERVLEAKHKFMALLQHSHRHDCARIIQHAWRAALARMHRRRARAAIPVLTNFFLAVFRRSQIRIVMYNYRMKITRLQRFWRRCYRVIRARREAVERLWQRTVAWRWEELLKYRGYLLAAVHEASQHAQFRSMLVMTTAEAPAPADDGPDTLAAESSAPGLFAPDASAAASAALHAVAKDLVSVSRAEQIRFGNLCVVWKQAEDECNAQAIIPHPPLPVPKEGGGHGHGGYNKRGSIVGSIAETPPGSASATNAPSFAAQFAQANQQHQQQQQHGSGNSSGSGGGGGGGGGGGVENHWERFILAMFVPYPPPSHQTQLASPTAAGGASAGSAVLASPRARHGRKGSDTPKAVRINSPKGISASSAAADSAAPKQDAIVQAPTRRSSHAGAAAAQLLVAQLTAINHNWNNYLLHSASPTTPGARRGSTAQGHGGGGAHGFPFPHASLERAWGEFEAYIGINRQTSVLKDLTMSLAGGAGSAADGTGASGASAPTSPQAIGGGGASGCSSATATRRIMLRVFYARLRSKHRKLIYQRRTFGSDHLMRGGDGLHSAHADTMSITGETESHHYSLDTGLVTQSASRWFHLLSVDAMQEFLMEAMLPRSLLQYQHSCIATAKELRKLLASDRGCTEKALQLPHHQGWPYFPLKFGSGGSASGAVHSSAANGGAGGGGGGSGSSGSGGAGMQAPPPPGSMVWTRAGIARNATHVRRTRTAGGKAHHGHGHGHHAGGAHHHDKGGKDEQHGGADAAAAAAAQQPASPTAGGSGTVSLSIRFAMTRGVEKKGPSQATVEAATAASAHVLTQRAAERAAASTSVVAPAMNIGGGSSSSSGSTPPQTPSFTPQPPALARPPSALNRRASMITVSEGVEPRVAAAETHQRGGGGIGGGGGGGAAVFDQLRVHVANPTHTPISTSSLASGGGSSSSSSSQPSSPTLAKRSMTLHGKKVESTPTAASAMAATAAKKTPSTIPKHK